MTPEPDEIWAIQTAVGHSGDLRPGVIIGSKSGKLFCMPMSSQLDTIDRNQDFLFDKSHPDFPAMGLNRSSYAMGNRIINIESIKLIHKLGKLSGKLREEFHDWLT